MSRYSTKRGLIAGVVVIALFVFANWPRSLNQVVFIAGFPLTFAVWIGDQVDSFELGYAIVDAGLALVCVATVCLLFAKSGVRGSDGSADCSHSPPV